MTTFKLTIEQAAKIATKNKDGTSDVFCRIEYNQKVYKTPIIKKATQPIWNFSQKFPLPSTISNQTIKITLHHQKKKCSLGFVEIPISEIVRQKNIDKWFKLDRENPTDTVSGSIKLKFICNDGLLEPDEALEASYSKSLKVPSRDDEKSEKSERSKKEKKEKKKDKKEGKKKDTKDGRKDVIEESKADETSTNETGNFSLQVLQPSSGGFQRNPLAHRSSGFQSSSGNPTPREGNIENKAPLGTLVVHLLDAIEVLAKDLNGKSDPFAELSFEGQQKVSKIHYCTLNPVWDETFMFHVYDYNSILTIELFDWDKSDKSDFLGIIQIPITSLTNTDQGIEEMSQKLQKRSKKSHVAGSLNYILEWHSGKSPEEVVCLFNEEKMQARRNQLKDAKDRGSKRIAPLSLIFPKNQTTCPGSLFVNAMEAKFDNEQLANRLKDKPICCEMVIEDFSLVTETKPGPRPKWTKGKTVFHISDKASQLKIRLYEGVEPKKQMMIAKGSSSISHLTRDPNQKQWCELKEIKSKEPSAMVRLNWRFESDEPEQQSQHTIGDLSLSIISARNIPDGNYNCVVLNGGLEVSSTASVSGSSPVWNEQMRIPVCQTGEIEILLKEKSDTIGSHTIKLSDLQQGDVSQAWFNLQGSVAQLRLKYELISSSGEMKSSFDTSVIPKGDPVGSLSVHISSATQLPKGDFYCEVNFEGQKKRTNTISNSQNPLWDQVFEFEVISTKSKVFIAIWDSRLQSTVGSTAIMIDTLCVSKKGQTEKFYSLETSIPNLKKQNPTIHVRCNWREKVKESPITLPPMSDLFSLDSVIDDSFSTKHDISYKVIVIGDSGVGKSNLLGRWIRNEFSIASVATVNVDWTSKIFKVKNKIVQVTFCDTAGQERYKSLTRQYFRGAHGVVLVYDITERSSFSHIASWLEEVKSSNDMMTPVLLLIGNKHDLNDERVVSTDEAIHFSKKEHMFFLETSAFDGSNCTKAMQLLLQYIHSNYSNTQTQEDSKLNPGIVLNPVPTNPEEMEQPPSEECAC